MRVSQNISSLSPRFTSPELNRTTHYGRVLATPSTQTFKCKQDIRLVLNYHAPSLVYLIGQYWNHSRLNRIITRL